MRKETYF